MTDMVALEEFTIVGYEQFMGSLSIWDDDGVSGGWRDVRYELEKVLGQREGWKFPTFRWELGKSCLPL